MELEGSTSLINRVIDEKYRIIERIGIGGMGEVYRGEDIRLQRPLAIKFLRTHTHPGSTGEATLKRFEREAKVAGRIDHPNAVSVFDYGVVQGIPYIVMNLIEGESLKQLLQEQGRLPLEQIVDILQQVASALEEAHSFGIVHRDLKPDNIMFEYQADGKRRAVVTDFGLAAFASDSLCSGGLTATGETLGTPLYMSPEQVQGLTCSPATDTYSLGVIAYELVAGDVPFRAEQAMSVLYKHLHDPPPALREIDPQLPELPAVESVLHRALAKSPQERFSSVSEFVSSLSTAIEQPALTTPHTVAVWSNPTPPQRPVVKLVFFAILLSLTTLLTLIFRESLGISKEAPLQTATKLSGAPLDKHTMRTSSETLREAEALIQRSLPKKALGLLEPLLKLEPRNPHVHFLLGQCFRQINRPLRAIEHLRRAVELDPQSALYTQALRNFESQVAQNHGRIQKLRSTVGNTLRERNAVPPKSIRDRLENRLKPPDKNLRRPVPTS